MNINYHLIDPTGNITILVDTPVKIEDQPKIGSMLMEREPTCEQVGFVQPGDKDADIVLRMAGGEFCGNATMSAAAFFCRNEKLTDGQSRDVIVRVLGVCDRVNVKITRVGNEYFGCVQMPKPISISNEKFYLDGQTYHYPVVRFPGIYHVVVDDGLSYMMAEKAIVQWCKEKNYEGMGLMMLGPDRKSLRPLVYIPDADTLVWESSCASGTTSVGAYFAYRDRCDYHFDFEEPGGVLSIDASKDGKLFLSGKVVFSR